MGLAVPVTETIMNMFRFLLATFGIARCCGSYDFMRYRKPVTEPSKNCRDRDLRPAATQFCRGFGDLCQSCAHLPRFR